MLERFLARLQSLNNGITDLYVGAAGAVVGTVVDFSEVHQHPLAPALASFGTVAVFAIVRFLIARNKTSADTATNQANIDAQERAQLLAGFQQLLKDQRVNFLENDKQRQVYYSERETWLREFYENKERLIRQEKHDAIERATIAEAKLFTLAHGGKLSANEMMPLLEKPQS